MSRLSFSTSNSPPRPRKASRSNTVSYVDKPVEMPLSAGTQAASNLCDSQSSPNLLKLEAPTTDKRVSVSDLPRLDLHNQHVTKLVGMLEQVQNIML